LKLNWHRLFGQSYKTRQSALRVAVDLDDRVEFFGNPLRERFPKDFFTIYEIAPSRGVTELDHVRISGWGMVYRRGLPSIYSENFASRTAVETMRECFRSYKPGQPRVELKEATLIAPTYVARGSYGDYWIEWLLALCYHQPPRSSPILVFEKNYVRYCEEDFLKLGYRMHIMKADGICVEKLHVLEPAQQFDNFTHSVVESLRAAFPAMPAPFGQSKDRKVYLCRHGFHRETRGVSSEARGFVNWQEIVDRLVLAGFEIVYPHNLTNQELRQHLQGVKVLVADHGAAMFHAVWDPPAILVELVNPAWFIPCFIKLSQKLPVRKHYVLTASDGAELPLGILDDILARITVGLRK